MIAFNGASDAKNVSAESPGGKHYYQRSKKSTQRVHTSARSKQLLYCLLVQRFKSL